MKNLSLVFIATMTLLLTSCYKPTEKNTIENNQVEKTARTRTNNITSGAWIMKQVGRQGNLIIEDRMSFHNNGYGSRFTKQVIGSLERKQYSYSWKLVKFDKELHLNQRLVRLNGSTNIDPVDRANELVKYRIVYLSSNRMNLRRIMPNGSLLSVESYRK